MMVRIWSGTSPLYLLLLPFSLIYGLISTLIRLSYRLNWRKVYHLPIPIVVVGNISAGGNGKTPLVIWLIKQLQQRGWKVGMVSRGYGGRAHHYPLVINTTTTTNECGDEPLLIYQRTGVPVAVAPQRVKAVISLLRSQSLDIVVTDDGLQHYALGRDIEWVVIDGERRFGNGWWLPAGPMRERASRLRTVHNVIINGGYTHSDEILMHLCAGEAINLLSNEHCSLTNLKSVVAMAGIAYPPRFFSTVRSSGLIPKREIVFSDHKIYSQRILEELTTSNEQLLMTEKDAVKCRSFAQANWWYLPVEAQLSSNAEQKLLEPIEQIIRNYQQIAKN